MKVQIYSLLATAAVVFCCQANAEQINVRAFCRAHPNNPGPGEESDVPAAVRAAGADHWRCSHGHVMVCYGGASGRACLRVEGMDARRRADFNQFCAQNPGADIPYSLTTGLTSEWHCNGAMPIQVGGGSSKGGYVPGAWRRL